MKLPEGEQWSFPPITPDPNNPEQYMTFTQLKAALSFNNRDQHLKDGTNEGCRTCRYIFTSEADKERHIRQIHSECKRKMGLHHNQRKVNLISNVVFAVKYPQQDINYKNTKMNEITNWEDVNQKKN